MAQFHIIARDPDTGTEHHKYFSSPDATSMKPVAIHKANMKARETGMARLHKEHGKALKFIEVRCVG